MKRGFLLALVAAACWCVLIVVIHGANGRTRLSAHGLLHLAVAEQCAARESSGWPTPPENPLFAGEPLPYYFFFHEVAVDVARLARCDLATAFEAMILTSALAVVLLGWALGRRLFRSDAAGLTLSLLLFAGAHPQGPLVLLARWLRHGADLFTARGFAADGDYLWGLVHPANGAMRIGDYWSTLGPLFAYFLNLTARPLALASLLAVAWMLERATTRPSAARLVVLALSVTLCTLWSPILGLSAAAALAAALPVAAWLRRGAGADGGGSGVDAALALSPKRALLLAAALGAGAALAFPWFRHLLARGDSAGRLTFNINRALGMATGAWLIALLAVVGLRRLEGARRTFALALLLAAALLCALTAIVALPVGNEDNFFHAALLLLAVPACGAVVPRRARAAAAVAAAEPASVEAAALERSARRRSNLLAAVFLPTLAVVLFSYSRRPPVPIAFTRAGIERLPATGREARLYHWIRTQTPHDAIFVQDPGREGRECVGNSSELPAFTGRCLFTDYAQHYLVAPNRDAHRRTELAPRLARGEAIAADDDRYLAALGRPLLIVSYDADAGVAAQLERAFGKPCFEADGIRVHPWRAHE